MIGIFDLDTNAAAYTGLNGGHQRSVHQEPMKVISFGKSIFADVKLRKSFWIRVGPKSKDK